MGSQWPRLDVFQGIAFGGPNEQTAKLCSVDLTGYNEREIPTPTDASDPAWSPLLP